MTTSEPRPTRAPSGRPGLALPAVGDDSIARTVSDRKPAGRALAGRALAGRALAGIALAASVFTLSACGSEGSNTASPDSDGTSTEPSGDDVIEPADDFSDDTEPDSTNSDSTEPDSSSSDAAQPGSTASDNTASDNTGSGNTGSGNTAPDSTAPDSTRSDGSDPDATQPGSTASNGTDAGGTPAPGNGTDPGGTPAPGTPAPETTRGTDAPSVPAGSAATPDSVVLTELAELSAPIAMAWRPGDDNLYVAERRGTIQRISPSGGTEQVLDASKLVVDTTSERGLLGITFGPGGDELFLSHTDPDGNSRITGVTVSTSDEGRLNAGAGDTRTLLRLDQPFANHNGGDIHLGPDGMLWAGFGDGGSAGDPMGHGQNADTLLGSMVRLDPATGNAASGNPFVDADGADEIWMIGLRNPWRFSFDAETDDLWIGDVGQNRFEEIDVLDAPGLGKGANLGWALREGANPFQGRSGPDANLVDPVLTIGRGPACSVTGGYVYRGERLAGLQGTYLYSDFCTTDIGTIVRNGGEVISSRLAVEGASLAQPIAFGEGPDRELYVMTLGGKLFRLDPA